MKSVCGTCIRTAAEARASERQHLLCSHQGRCQLRAHQGRRRQRVRMRLLLLLCSIQLGRQHAYIRAAAAAAAPSRAVGSSSNLQAQAVQASKQHRSVPASAPWSTHPPRHLNLIPSRAVAGLLHNPYCSTKVLCSVTLNLQKLTDMKKMCPVVQNFRCINCQNFRTLVL